MFRSLTVAATCLLALAACGQGTAPVSISDPPSEAVETLEMSGSLPDVAIDGEQIAAVDADDPVAVVEASNGIATPADGKAAESKAVEVKSLMLTRTRSYRLDVGKLNSQVYVGLAKQWVFGDAFPADLLAGIKKHAKLDTSKQELFLNDDGEAEQDSGYIRWLPDEDGRDGTGALLWYVNGEKRKELVISVDVVLDHSLAKDQDAAKHAFDSLQVTVDLNESKLTGTQWGDAKLVELVGDSQNVEISDTVQVSVTGSLTAESSQSVKLADRLLSDEVTGVFSRLGRADFVNESHHGITLGWLGQEDLQHGLMFMSGGQNDGIDFRYSISGNSFPLQLVRNQLADNGWPLVLHGSEFVGSSDDGVQVFRPVEYLLSKESPQQPVPDEPPADKPAEKPAAEPNKKPAAKPDKKPASTEKKPAESDKKPASDPTKNDAAKPQKKSTG